MKIHRFILNNQELNKKLILSEPGLVHQFSRVLGFEVGEQIILCDGKGAEALYTIAAISAHSISLTAEKLTNAEKRVGREVILCLSVLKRDNFELAAQKAAEIGVRKLIPLISERTIKTGVKKERLSSIAHEAAELSGQTRVMEIEDPQSFETIIAAIPKQTVSFFLDKTAEKSLLNSTQELKKDGPVYIFVGPEGGWTKRELDMARANGSQIAHLGSAMLRAETAAIISSYLAVQL